MTEKENNNPGKCPCCGSDLNYDPIHYDFSAADCTNKDCGFMHSWDPDRPNTTMLILQENAKAKDHLKIAIESLKDIIEAESPTAMFESAKDALESMGAGVDS